MKFNHYTLGFLEKSQQIEVNLQGNAANVLLLDNKNYQQYKQGTRYIHIGGLVVKSPHRFVVPKSGQWHLVIDLGGYAGKVKSQVVVHPLPQVHENDR
mgnify:FL=1